MNEEILENEKRWLLEEKYKGIENDDYFSDVCKLESGYPVAYLIGDISFLGCHIDLHHRPLIPRPETEQWVKQVISEYKNKDVKVLDLFSGSGCIGISILKNIEHPRVDFGELNPKFISQIEKNIEINFLGKSDYRIYKTDMFSNIPKEEDCRLNGHARECLMGYDLILTNPPYIDENKKNTVQKSVIDNEDHNSLFAPDDGLFFIKKIISEGINYLKVKGKIYIEYDPWQTELIDNYLQKKGFNNYEFIKDQFEKERVLMIQKNLPQQK